MAIKVFITDDHYMVIEGIRSLLQNENGVEWIGHATNAASCLAFLQKQQPDVILLDINLPDKSGIDLCKEIKELYPSIFILGLSTYNQQSFIQKMIDNGASGYLLKNATSKELVEAIETVVLGKTYFSHEAAQVMKQHKNETIPVITRRETEVLELISIGMTNIEIAHKLFLSTSTIDTHRKNLLAKFDAKNVALMVRMAIKLKYI